MKNAPHRQAAPREPIWTLKVELAFSAFAEGPWEATLEIASSATLEHLHLAIQDAVRFENDHMYMFYVARTLRSRDRVGFDDEDGSLDTTLAEVFPLSKDRKLFYWFDFGDDWKFSIQCTRAAPKGADKGTRYPRVLAVRRGAPIQYPSWE